MNRLKRFPLAVLAVSALALTGCLNLTRGTDPTRFYVLSALPAGTPPAVGSAGNLAVGLGRVNIPDYLLDRRIALRHGASEIHYTEYHRWAERLDKGVQRVMGANLSALLSPERVALTAWQRSDVAAEVYVSVQRFGCNERGKVILEAQWRIASPGGETTWRTENALITRQGPDFRENPEGAVGELSNALADLSRQIAATVQTVSAHPPVPQPERAP